mmetsp:Transcript_9178/g.9129  ORF Transcript_9178/g.9129 Transcript_9178/m.9129 type:complete len:281 (-) Transcript_9178:36-878(-)
MKCLADALREYDYKYLKEVHLWDAGIEDEGARSLSMYLVNAISMRTIEIVNSKISPLGCEFIGQIFGIGSRNFILSLKLDYNNFGDAGVELLSRGLRLNQTLFHLSLAFCGITGEGARYIMEIIINQQCNIKDLNLQGNCLRNQGVVILFRGLMINSSVVSVDLTDNQFGEEELVLTTLRNLIFTNKSLKNLDFTHNGFYETGAQFILGFLTEKNEEGGDIVYAINEIKLPEKISRDTIKAIEKAIKDNKKLRTKGKKKKKGKKKGKKKKKKKKGKNCWR